MQPQASVLHKHIMWTNCASNAYSLNRQRKNGTSKIFLMKVRNESLVFSREQDQSVKVNLDLSFTREES